MAPAAALPLDVFAAVLAPFCSPEDIAHLSITSTQMQVLDADLVWHRSFCRGMCARCAAGCKKAFAARRRAALAALSAISEGTGREARAMAVAEGRATRLYDDDRSMVRFLHLSARLTPKARSLLAEGSGQLELFFEQGFIDLSTEIDGAVRRLVRRFVLPPEATRLDRVAKQFARVYSRKHAAHPLYACPDRCHILTTALLLLNTDLHSRHVRHRMTEEAFARNVTAALCPDFLSADDMPAGFLEGIYRRIQEAPLVFGHDGLFAPPRAAQDRGRNRACAIQ